MNSVIFRIPSIIQQDVQFLSGVSRANNAVELTREQRAERNKLIFYVAVRCVALIAAVFIAVKGFKTKAVISTLFSLLVCREAFLLAYNQTRITNALNLMKNEINQTEAPTRNPRNPRLAINAGETVRLIADVFSDNAGIFSKLQREENAGLYDIAHPLAHGTVLAPLWSRLAIRSLLGETAPIIEAIFTRMQEEIRASITEGRNFNPTELLAQFGIAMPTGMAAAFQLAALRNQH